VLDLFAGSGSLAIEAMSRGARAAVCVERSPGALACIRSNLEALDLARAVRVVPGDVARVLRRLGRQHECFDLALLDPPYASDEAQRAFEALVEASILAPGAVVVLERGRRHLSPQVDGLVQTDERRYGDTVIVRFRVAPSLRTSQ